MTRTRTRLAVVGIALLMVGSAVAVSPATDTAAAAEHAFVVEQGGRCVEVSPLSNGEDVRSFYDYRNVENEDGESRYTYSSYMPGNLKRADTSRLFLYDGPNGVSLVIVHNTLGGDRGDGSAATFRFGGLPSGGDWVVQDDDYSDQDDRFSRDRIDWTWYGDRTDGGVFRGVDRDGTEITVNPAFDEQAALYDSPVQRSGTTEAWQFLSGSVGDPSAVALDMNELITIRTGRCGPDETAPSAELAADDGIVGFSIAFDASESTDDRGIAEYRWDFDGDGETDRTTGDPTVTRTYAEAGEYRVSVTVVDAAGNADSAQTTVSVESDDPPEVALETGDGVVGFPVAFDAGNSTDERGIAEYRWDFDGDGDAERTTEDPSVTRTYDEAGDYEVALTVVDGAGRNATATRTVSVAADDPPDPAFRVASPEPLVEGEQVVLDAGNSTDDTGIATYRWRIGNDTTTTGERVATTFDGNGTFPVTLEVVDEGGNNATQTSDVEVLPDDGTPPSAALSVGTNRTETGAELSFDASDSTDDETSVATYRWDFDGDGQTDQTTSDPTVSHAYESEGTYNATVTAVDRAGNVDEAKVAVEVELDEKAHGGDEDGGGGGSGGGSSGSSGGGGSSGSSGGSSGSSGGSSGSSGGGSSGGASGGNGGASSGGGGGGGGADLGPPPILTNPEKRGPNAGLVDVRHGRTDETIRADLPATDAAEETGVAFREVRVDLARDETHFVVETAREDGEFADGATPADVSLASLSVGANYVEPRQVERVGYTVAIERSKLADAGLAPADLRAYQRTGDEWERANATVESRGETVLLAVESDEFVPVAVGGERTVTVADAELAASAVAVDEPVVANATLENEGESAARFALNLTADGEVVSTERVEVPAGERIEVSLDASLAPGTHAVGLAGERLGPATERVADVTVAEPTANVVVANVSVNESVVAAGEEVAVTATVRNEGSEDGERTIALALFGEEVATERVTVSANETEHVTFVRQADAPGNYTAEVGNETAEISVEGDGGSGSPDVPVPGFGVGTAVVALLAALVTFRARE